MPTPAQIVDSTFALYALHGSDDYIGEAITQLEHMSQAAQLAMAEGFDDEVVLAAFFHDIGHLCGGDASMGGYGVASHERIGAEYLRRCGFVLWDTQYPTPHLASLGGQAISRAAYRQRLMQAVRRPVRFAQGPLPEPQALSQEITQTS